MRSAVDMSATPMAFTAGSHATRPSAYDISEVDGFFSLDFALRLCIADKMYGSCRFFSEGFTFFRYNGR